MYKVAASIIADSDKVRQSAQADEQTFETGVNRSLSGAENTLKTVGGIALLFGLIAAFFISRSITKPVISMTRTMGQLAEGDNSVDIPGLARQDELGQMAKALSVFKDNAIRSQQLEAEQEEQKRVAEAEKHQMMLQLADNFDSHVGGIVNSVSSASYQLNANRSLHGRCVRGNRKSGQRGVGRLAADLEQRPDRGVSHRGNDQHYCRDQRAGVPRRPFGPRCHEQGRGRPTSRWKRWPARPTALARSSR